MKHKTVAPEHKLLQAILERKKRYQWRLVALRKLDYDEHCDGNAAGVLEELIGELDELLRLYGAYVRESSCHGDCVPVTGQTVMNLRLSE